MNSDTNEFAELSKDANFKATIVQFRKNLGEIKRYVEVACGSSVYDELSLEDKVKYDLFLTYSLNSMFWLYLRTQGLDPSKHDVKAEIERVRSYTTKAKQAYDRKYVMKHIDKDAAGRFIRNGLWEPGEKANKTQTIE